VLKLYGVGQELEMDAGEHAQENWAVYSGLATWYVVAPLSGAGAAVLWRRRRGDLLLPLVATPAVTLLGVAALFGQTRYAAPMSPAVVVLAAVAIDAWSSRRSPRPEEGEGAGRAADGDASPVPHADPVVVPV
jgi:hypothetical protein